MTVPKITTNEIGRILSAPLTPACVRSSPNAEAVAAATIPRGAIQAMKARSRRESFDLQAATATSRGRSTNTMTAIRPKLSQSTAFTWRGHGGRDQDEEHADQQADEGSVELEDPRDVELALVGHRDSHRRRRDESGVLLDQVRADQGGGHAHQGSRHSLSRSRPLQPAQKDPEHSGGDGAHRQAHDEAQE